MTTVHDLERRLNEWMQEDATLPDELREALARLPETKQLRHRWSFTFAELQWRTSTMFSATRVAATVAIFALGASLTFLAGPSRPSSEGAPGQAAATPPERPVLVSGVSTVVRAEDLGAVSMVGGVPTVVGNISEVEATLDDPRVSGTYRLTQNAQDRGDMGPMWGAMRVENEDGAWEGPVEGIWTFRDTHFSGCLAGEAAYAGHTYCLRVAADSIARDVVIEGLVYAGGLPPTE